MLMDQSVLCFWGGVGGLITMPNVAACVMPL